MIQIILVFASICWAESGFVKTKNALVPQTVSAASESVYRIVSLTSVEFVASSTNDEIQNYLAQNCRQKPANFLFALKCTHFRKCLKSSGSCKDIYLNSGTAFLADSARTLYTAWHVLAEQFETQLIFFEGVLAKQKTDDRNRTLSELGPEFLLYNHQGHLVFDSRREIVQPKFINIGDPIGYRSLANHTEKKGLERLVDFVKIKLNQDLGRPLEFAVAGAFTAQTPVYLIGFPGKTTDRLANSNGYDLFVSKGLRISQAQFFKQLELHPHASEETLNAGPDNDKKYFSDNYFLFHDADAVSGNSGGPVVTAQGLVLGMELGESNAKTAVKEISPMSIATVQPWLNMFDIKFDP